MSTSPERPLALQRDEGEAWWWGDSLAVIKATAADTGGELTVVEMTSPPSVTPAAVSTKYRIFWWTLDGEVTFEGEEGDLVVGPGGFYSSPRGAPTGVRVGKSGCRALMIVVPAGFEEVIRALSEPAESLTLPPPPGVSPRFDPSELFAEHGLRPADWRERMDNREITRLEMEEIFSKGNYDLIDQVYAEGYISHDPFLPEPIRGRQGVRAFVEGIRAGLEGLWERVEDQVVEGDKVVTRWTAGGRHTGELFGVPPTGNDVEITGVSIERFENGKIVEDWTMSDGYGLLRQLGALPDAVSAVAEADQPVSGAV